MELLKKRILLTGASGGIGREIAAVLAAAGAELILVGRRAEPLQALALSLPGNPYWLDADITVAGDRARLVALVRDLGGLDMLINNAGGHHFAWLQDQSGKQIESQITLNLIAPIMLVHDLLPLMMASEQPVVLNIGSTFGSIGHAGFSAYCASKFGLRGFSEALSRELADTPVKVCYLAPRATRTDLNGPRVDALNQALGTGTDLPGVVADQVIRLLREPSRPRVFLGWPEKLFIVLNSLLPWLIDVAMRKQLPVVKRFAHLEETSV